MQKILILILKSSLIIIYSKPNISKLSQALDDNLKTGFTFPSEGEFVIDINAKEFFTARSLTISTIEVPMVANVQFQAKKDNGEFITIKDFEIDRSNSNISVGFVPWAPVVISFPKVTASDFRLIFDYKNTQNEWVYPQNEEISGIAEIVISETPRVERGGTMVDVYWIGRVTESSMSPGSEGEFEPMEPVLQYKDLAPLLFYVMNWSTSFDQTRRLLK